MVGRYDTHGSAVETKTIKSAGAAAAIVLSPDRARIRADRGDLSYVTATVVDDAGVLVPTAAAEISFTVAGAGELAAVGSGDPADIGSFYRPSRRAYRGKAVAIVRPGSVSGGPVAAGTVTVTATAAGLKSASVTIVTE